MVIFRNKGEKLPTGGGIKQQPLNHQKPPTYGWQLTKISSLELSAWLAGSWNMSASLLYPVIAYWWCPGNVPCRLHLSRTYDLFTSWVLRAPTLPPERTFQFKGISMQHKMFFHLQILLIVLLPFSLINLTLQWDDIE